MRAIVHQVQTSVRLCIFEYDNRCLSTGRLREEDPAVKLRDVYVLRVGQFILQRNTA